MSPIGMVAYARPGEAVNVPDGIHGAGRARRDAVCSPGARRTVMAGTDLFEIIHTTRAMRRLKPDPVPDELIGKILEAGICAPNGGKTQRWGLPGPQDTAVKSKVPAGDKRGVDQ